jgi:hypothetical protein
MLQDWERRKRHIYIMLNNGDEFIKVIFKKFYKYYFLKIEEIKKLNIKVSPNHLLFDSLSVYFEPNF